jgi:hypothetical protein
MPPPGLLPAGGLDWERIVIPGVDNGNAHP